jgi:pSer/pThr/pTyr-binding forkhead associated (FHA) protein
MLKIRFKDNKYNAVWLVEPKITIGRSATNALVIDDPIAGDVHIEVLVDNENLTLNNLLPAIPVMVNDVKVINSCELKPDDQITIGAVELIVIDPKRESKSLVEETGNATELRGSKNTGWSLKANHAALANRVFPLKELMVIGRANDCDISLAAAHLSRRHAQLQVVDGMLFVKDLGSANGTFLNGQQVTEARVRRGDELRFDALTFGVMGPADDLAKTSVRKLSDKTPDSKPEPKSAERASARAAQRPVPPTRASSPHPKAGKGEEASGKGRLGLIFLGVLAVVVITVLIFTRK